MRKVTGFPLWLGHAGDVRDPAAVLEAGISAVVCVAGSEPVPSLPAQAASIAAFRWSTAPTIQSGFCERRSRRWRGCCAPGLPHCCTVRAGISRSPAVAGAAIALASGCSPEEGLIAATRSAPPTCRLDCGNRSYWRSRERFTGSNRRRRSGFSMDPSVTR